MAEKVDAELSEELDYHITFPSPIPDDVSDEETLDYYNQANAQKEPVIILLGWMGCKEKHLAKYSAIYEHKKCITISYTLSAEKLFSGGDQIRPVAIKVLEMVEDLSLDENPIIFHVMSNAGAILYRYVCEVLRTDPQFANLKVRGSVFDSAPGQRKISSAVKAVSASMQRHPIINYIVALAFALFMLCRMVYQKLAEIIGLGGNAVDHYSALLRDPAEWPQLYLYSRADDLIDYRDVDHVVETRRKHGHLVLSLCWDDSPHVAHLRQHRETYIKQCYDFLDICTALDNPEDM